MANKEEQERMTSLLKDTIALLCKSGIQCQQQIQVQGLLGITVDDSHVFLVDIRETWRSESSSHAKDTVTEMPDSSVCVEEPLTASCDWSNIGDNALSDGCHGSVCNIKVEKDLKKDHTGLQNDGALQVPHWASSTQRVKRKRSCAGASNSDCTPPAKKSATITASGCGSQSSDLSLPQTAQPHVTGIASDQNSTTESAVDGRWTAVGGTLPPAVTVPSMDPIEELVLGSGVYLPTSVLQSVEQRGDIRREIGGTLVNVQDGATMARALMSKFFKPQDLVNATLSEKVREGEYQLNPVIIESIVAWTMSHSNYNCSRGQVKKAMWNIITSKRCKTRYSQLRTQQQTATRDNVLGDDIESAASNG